MEGRRHCSLPDLVLVVMEEDRRACFEVDLGRTASSFVVGSCAVAGDEGRTEVADTVVAEVDTES